MRALQPHRHPVPRVCVQDCLYPVESSKSMTMTDPPFPFHRYCLSSKPLIPLNLQSENTTELYPIKLAPSLLRLQPCVQISSRCRRTARLINEPSPCSTETNVRWRQVADVRESIAYFTSVSPWSVQETPGGKKYTRFALSSANSWLTTWARLANTIPAAPAPNRDWREDLPVI